MKSGTTLVATLFAVATFPLLAQQPPPGSQPNRPAPPQYPASAEQAPPTSPAAGPQAPVIEMSSVNGELVSKLDSKTAKTGDSVVVQTKSSVKTADGTEIPKGSKLVGHVLAAKPSGPGENSQVALQFDHIELKGGQSMPIHSQIQSIAPAGAASPSASGVMSAPPAAGSANSSTSAANANSTASGPPQSTGAGPGTAAENTAPAAGTVVARTGNIAIATTSVPGLLLANNAPGQQDPRMAQASSILLSAKQDIELDGGTKMVLGVATAGAGTQ